MIRHTVAFTLKHSAGSAEEARFLQEAFVLKTIPMVERFEQLRQISTKCEHAFGFSMEFADQAAYDAYNHHPIHERFVAEFWVTQVSAFQEIDYQPL